MSPVANTLVVVTAVRPETRAVLDLLRSVRRVASAGTPAWQGDLGGRPVHLVQSGIGPVRAARALEAVTPPHALVVSVGFAGALTPDAATGDVVLPTTVLWDARGTLETYPIPPATRHTAHAILAASSDRRVLGGPLWSSAEIVASPADKRAAADRTGAVAVEMEAAGLIPVARRHGIDVLVLRTILDTVDLSLAALPPDLDGSWRARAQLIGRPRAWPAVWNVARHVPAATRSLARALAAVLPAI